ncbi:aldehyde dehydrogenase (NADP(+)) [Occultella kanbiaonis]|uniref:aldehyde dehydrogenase (NADP(+)) n=1 Tax=Occultella kanbiaonis TaxID=2675754 RepID=UPI0013D83600|nr:aldehyde dehydrogenase (NADP(+)) [Occultella kanbiaonis]
MTTKDELDAAVQQAQVAFLAARGAEPDIRAGWLEAIADGLDAAAGELVPLAQSETHLAEGRLQGELKRTTFQLRLFAEEVRSGDLLDATIDHADDSWGMGPRPDLRRINVPLGVVGVFGASNFPFAFSVMGGDSASALAAGCAVVHKIHEAHLQLGLRTAEIVVAALAQAGAPEDLFSAVTGRDAGEALVDHPLTMAVGFTGSTRVGRILADRAAARPEPIPFYGELGSINPVVVTPQAWAARRDEILTAYVGSYTLGMGQFCTKPGLLFVPRLDENSTQVLRETVAGSDPSPMLTTGLAEGFLHARSAMAQRGLTEIVPGGQGDAPAPALFATTVEAAVQDPEIVRDEMFGPASIVVSYRDEAELTRGVELLEGQLTTTIHAEPGEELDELVNVLAARSGRVIWNSWPTGVTVSYAQQHGGPYPATTAPGTTSVGTAAARRFMRPVSYQGFPEASLPPALREGNPLAISRRVDGEWQLGGGAK